MTLSISLPAEVEARLRNKAAAAGQSLDDYAFHVLESAATKASVDEVLAPFRKQVADSNMTDAELDGFLDDLREKAYQDRKRRPA